MILRLGGFTVSGGKSSSPRMRNIFVSSMTRADGGRRALLPLFPQPGLPAAPAVVEWTLGLAPRLNLKSCQSAFVPHKEEGL